MNRSLSLAEFEQRRAAATTHGARSEVRVRAVATVQKRRLLRQVGLRACDLDGIALGYLDAWARAQSTVELYDSWAGEYAWLTEAAESPPFVREYFAAVNSARLSLAKLEGHLRDRRDVDAPLAAFLVEGRAIRQRWGFADKGPLA